MKKTNIEIVKRSNCTVPDDYLRQACAEYLTKEKNLRSDTIISNFDNNHLNRCLISIIINDLDTNISQMSTIEFFEKWVVWHIYQLDEMGPQDDVILGDGDEASVCLSTNWALPSQNLHGLWENLVYDNDVKQNLLRYMKTTMLFSTKQVDTTVVTSNRVVLLHGPPGTGKTSLCKALAQKLSVRFQNIFPIAHLVEINSHSLFSKWFSESGKLVTKMFSRIKLLCEDPESLVFVLIDEVESLAHARSQAMSGTEPSDSIRVVNAMLTQLDQLQRCNNVMVLTTSNLTSTIDVAFVDRADIKQYIGLPSVNAIYQIYQSCIQELLKACIIIHDANMIMPLNTLSINGMDQMSSCSTSLELLEICKQSVGLSGRTLRKIPFLAHALFVDEDFVPLTQFLKAMKMAIEKHKADAQYI